MRESDRQVLLRANRGQGVRGSRHERMTYDLWVKQAGYCPSVLVVVVGEKVIITPQQETQKYLLSVHLNSLQQQYFRKSTHVHIETLLPLQKSTWKNTQCVKEQTTNSMGHFSSVCNIRVSGLFIHTVHPSHSTVGHSITIIIIIT